MKKQKRLLNKADAHDEKDPLDRDLSDFISDGLKDGSWSFVRFELREKKDKVLSIRLSEKLLNEIKQQAKAAGIDTQKFVRIMLESSLRKKAG